MLALWHGCASYSGATVTLAEPPYTVIPSTDGVSIALHDLGGPDDPAAPVLLFSHATGFCGRVWEPMATFLSARYRCLAIDYRGHGMADTPAGTSLDWTGLGDDVMAVLDSGLIGPDSKVYGVAHSMGGAALTMAAARRPGAFRALWLYEPVIVPPGMLPPPSVANPMAEAAARRREFFDSADEAFANFASKPPLNQLHPDALRSYVRGGFVVQSDGQVRLRCRPSTEAAVYRGAADSGTWELLADLSLPVAVITGRPGEFGPVQFAPMVARALPEGTLVNFPDRGHFGPLEDPASMAEHVRGWVQRFP